MLNALRNIFLSLLKSKWEHFVVIEQTQGALEVTNAKINNRDKKIHVLKHYTTESFDSLKKPFRVVDKLILALDSRHSTTIESVVRLKRAEPRKPIGESELDTLVFRGLWEFLSRYRSWAAKKMGVTDLDLVLANAEIRDVALGPYNVFNPLGFKGSTLFLRFRGTLIPRESLRLVEKLKSWGKNLVLVEGESIVSLSMPASADYVIHPGTHTTSMFALGGDERAYYKDVSWGTNKVRDRLMNDFLLDAEVAELVFERYANGRVSERAYRIFTIALRQEFQRFFDLTILACKKSRVSKGYVSYFHFRFPTRFLEPLFRKYRIHPVRMKNSLERQGYDVIIKKEKSSKTYDSILAFLTHQYSYPQYKFLNQLLKRRAKWLIPRT